MQRSSGILLPVSALPSPYGVGTLGKAAYEFATFLKDAGQRFWQVLPLGPTGLGDSPYTSFSTFAGNPYFIDLDLLIEEGLLEREYVEQFDWGKDPEHVDYAALRANRFTVLRKACEAGFPRQEAEVKRFAEEQKWLPDYALFMAARDYFGDGSWQDWPDEGLRKRTPEALAKYRELLKEDIRFYTYVQYLFFKQWTALKKYVNNLGIHIIGDVPIYVAMDSADTWREPQFFALGEDLVPKEVAGVPPDYFSEEGQLWGNPLYDWDAMKADGYGWWIRRMEGAKQLYDMVRIDHFRAFESYWAVPYGAASAKAGTWHKGPGMDLLRVLRDWFYDLDYIAEDLGILTPAVTDLLEQTGFPGMNVLQFAFSADGSSKYLPHRMKRNSVCYAGTHDNNTCLGWWEDPAVPQEDKDFAVTYLGLNEQEGPVLGLLRGGLQSPADLFVAQMQDWLQLPGSARMNVPGVALGNWAWRMLPGAATAALAKQIAKRTKIYDR